MSSIHLVGVTVGHVKQTMLATCPTQPTPSIAPTLCKKSSLRNRRIRTLKEAIVLHVFRQCGPYSVVYQGHEQSGSCSGSGHTRADIVSVLVCLQMLLVDRDCIRVQQLMIRHVGLQTLLVFSAEYDHCTGVIAKILK